MVGSVWLKAALSLSTLLMMATTGFGQQQLPTEAPVGPYPPSPIEGIWQTQLASQVTIAPCPQGWCGTLSKIVVPSEGLSPEELAAAQQMPVEAFTDMRNPDPALRGRPMLGLQMLTLWPGKEPHIFDGEIYNPQDGNTYSGYIEMLGPDMVRLRGCVLFNVICQGEDWVRVIPEPELEAQQ
jgi:Uncharacterized protein conserved in bacteria